MRSGLPKFDGWFPIAEDAKIADGDVWVFIGDSKVYPKNADKMTVASGKKCSGFFIGDTQNYAGYLDTWAIYRPIGKKPIRSNPHFSQPLPLP